MGVSKQYLDYLLGQLKRLGGVEARRMFGGLGLYSGGTFFGLLYRERLYFKTDDSTRPEYEARGSEGFQPRADVKNMKMTYYTVPAEVLEDEEEVVRWARKAVTAALTKDAAKGATARGLGARAAALTKSAGGAAGPRPRSKRTSAPRAKSARKPAKRTRAK